MKNWTRVVGWSLLAAGVLAVAVALLSLTLGPLTRLIGGSELLALSGKERADATNSVRQTVLAGLTGVFAATGIVFTARTYLTNRRNQFTERYAKAVALLASDKLDERMGGIYSLRHILVESKQDRDAVISVLAAFIREHSYEYLVHAYPARVYGPDGEEDRDEFFQHEKKIGPDIQAALSAILTASDRSEAYPVDLSDAALPYAYFPGGKLHGATLDRVHLYHARLVGVDLKGASLRDTNFAHAVLENVNFKGTFLWETNFTGAMVENSDFSAVTSFRPYLTNTEDRGGNVGWPPPERSTAYEHRPTS